MPRDEDFPRVVQQQALDRQGYVCASCGERIAFLGEKGRKENRFKEIGHGHHVRPIHSQGTADVSNCVVICQSCHYSAHEGGWYKKHDGAVVGRQSDYPYYRK